MLLAYQGKTKYQNVVDEIMDLAMLVNILFLLCIIQ